MQSVIAGHARPHVKYWGIEMDKCKQPGCGSYAINEFPESGYCDRCYWWNEAAQLKTVLGKTEEAGTYYLGQVETLTAENERLRLALAGVEGCGHNDHCIFCGHKDLWCKQALEGR